MNKTYKTLLIISAITVSSLVYVTANAYDYVVKDKYGRVVAYGNDKDGKYIQYDKFGKKEYEIEKDGTVEDEYGRNKFYIDKDWYYNSFSK